MAVFTSAFFANGNYNGPKNFFANYDPLIGPGHWFRSGGPSDPDPDGYYSFYGNFLDYDLINNFPTGTVTEVRYNPAGISGAAWTVTGLSYDFFEVQLYIEDGVPFTTGVQTENTYRPGSAADEIVGADFVDRFNTQPAQLFLNDTSNDLVDYAAHAQPIVVQLDVFEGFASGTTVGTDSLFSIEHAIGGKSHDSITGSEVGNRLGGLGGNDTLDGGLGADTMRGGLGNDTFFVDDGADQVLENAGEGTDLVRALLSKALFPNVENLVLEGVGDLNGAGTALANSLIGNAGANVLDGRGGADRMFGHAGNDTYIVDDPGDFVGEVAGNGTDTVKATITHTLGSHVEGLQLLGTTDIDGAGNSGANSITGNDGSNRLDGGAGGDHISGSAGNDTIVGGLGLDYLTGGLGNDDFVYGAAIESAGSAVDRILDFAAGDRIWLNAIDANTTLANDQAFVLDTDASFSAGEIRQRVVGSNLLVEMNTDATTTAEMTLLLIGRNTLLGAADLVL
ncbi:MAG: calcium-binding protein [Hyphomicrobiaceae bacterium]|nr:calcium-binding protein [Hyphomicrobiaceae bacterium]